MSPGTGGRRQGLSPSSALAHSLTLGMTLLGLSFSICPATSLLDLESSP